MHAAAQLKSLTRETGAGLLAPPSRLRRSKRRSVFVTSLRSPTKTGAPKGSTIS